jgi:HlyD family secretion protein
VCSSDLQLDEASIVAPFDGIIAALDIKKGDYFSGPGLNSGTPVLLIDSASLEISTEIDEIDVAGVQINQTASISLDALPGTRFAGKVSSVSITPKERAQNSGIVVYDVKVVFDGVSPVQVKSGMSASIDIITVEKKSVLMVPNKYIKQNSQGQKIVSILVDKQTQDQPVTLGLTDGSHTEIISGLNEGDIIIQ